MHATDSSLSVSGRALRVMIVDDSLLFRTALREILSEENDIEVVSQAVNGRLAIPRIRHYKPDFVVLDLEMPEMDGLETLKVIRVQFPEVRVIMFSSHSLGGVTSTIQALEHGAVDFVTKPDASNEQNIKDYIKDKLVTLLRQLWDGKSSPVEQKISSEEKVEQMAGYYDVCAIGVSTGGPAALRKLLAKIPRSLDGSLLIVQHMPPLFTRQLAESLNATSELTVVEGEAGMSIEGGKVYIAPGGCHMAVQKKHNASVIKLLNTAPEKNCKPAVNILFRSVAKSFKDKSVGLIMTGMGEDGYLGMKEMKKSGAYLLAQEESSCLVYGMPAKPIESGLVNEALDIDALAARIVYLVGER